MGQVFISFEKSDADVVIPLAAGLEQHGIRTWYYLRDSLPGPSYLRQIAAAVTECQAVVVVVSPASMRSEQVTSEVVQAFEQHKPLVPLLRGMSHPDLQKGNPEWRGAFRAATSVEIPAAGVAGLLPNLIKGLGLLGVSSPAAPVVPAVVLPPVPPAAAAPPGSPRVELAARFDRTAYPPGDDPLVYWLAELQVDGEAASGPARPGADVALVLDVSGSMDKPNRYPLLREAVRRLVGGLGPQDRVSVTLFSDRSQTAVPFLSGADAADDPEHILRAMDAADNMFGGQTMLAPALQLALGAFARLPRAAGRVRRAYVLTDGELHDVEGCEVALRGFRPQSVEVHVYGFGEDFNAAALKRLVGDQIGGTVKPIVSEPDIGRVFAHVAAVNRRLIGQDGKLTVALPPGVVCGDAWVYQPHGRYLGPIQGGRVEHLFGGIESGRRYSLLLEVRLPPGGPVASLEATWTTGERTDAHRAEAVAPRAAEPGVPVADVRRAADILHVLRAANDKDAQLASYRARRELAVLENRDPELIAALDKLIAGVTEPQAAGGGAVPDIGTAVMDRPAAAPVSPARPPVLSEREQLLIESDGLTSPQLEEVRSVPEPRADIIPLLTSGQSAAVVIEAVIRVLVRYVNQGYDRGRAADLLEDVARHLNLPRSEQTGSRERFRDALDRGDPNAF